MENQPKTTIKSFIPLKNSNGTPFDSSTKLPVRFESGAPEARPNSNLRWYKSNVELGLKRHKTTTYSIDKDTNEITDLLKEIHDSNNYDKEYKKPFKINGKYYLKSSLNNNIFDYDNDNLIIGTWNNIQKKIDFIN